MGVRVTLSQMEIACAVSVGSKRHLHALERRRADQHGCDPDKQDGWGIHIEGAAGEIVVAKFWGVYYPMTIDTFRRLPDVGECEVRTRSNPTYQLNVRENDDDDAPYILVRGRIPTFEIVGWLYGYEAKRNEWKKDYANREVAYFPPDNVLHAIVPEHMPRNRRSQRASA